jgi:plasmid maintenance system antidote protein VapI
MSEKSTPPSSVFDHSDYRSYLRRWIDASPKGGRGQISRIAEAAGVHKTTLSQIFSGTKELSLEQAHRVTQYLGLARGETEYFLLLVEHERAGSAALKEVFRAQMEERKAARQQLSTRVTRSRELSSEERAIYYSNWIYSAVRNLTAIRSIRTPQAIARQLGLEPAHVHRVLEFLLKTGLSIEKSGEILPGPQMTHLEADSPLVARHHGNWRVKAMERHPVLRDKDELAYTAPMTLSQEDALKVRALLADVVEKTDQIVGPSPSEKLYCMALDWFEVR